MREWMGVGGGWWRACGDGVEAHTLTGDCQWLYQRSLSNTIQRIGPPTYTPPASRQQTSSRTAYSQPAPACGGASFGEAVWGCRVGRIMRCSLGFVCVDEALLRCSCLLPQLFHQRGGVTTDHLTLSVALSLQEVANSEVTVQRQQLFIEDGHVRTLPDGGDSRDIRRHCKQVRAEDSERARESGSGREE